MNGAEDIITNPPKEFTEPCEACGVSEFQLGVKHAEERIIKLLESKLCWCVGQPLNKDNGREELMKHMNCHWEAMMIEYHVALIKGEQK